MKDASSTRWYWEPTGNDITEFVWGPFQPDISDDTVRVCIDFRLGYDWEDDQCDDAYLLGKICE